MKSNIDKRTIVVIEDNLDDQVLILSALKDAGAKNPVLFLNNGQEAVEYFFRQSELVKTPCFVILDLILPDIRGLDLLKKLRANEKTRYLPIIIMTDSSEEQDVYASYQTGANSYVVKTWSYEDFREKMRYIVQYWLEVAQVPPDTSQRA